MDGPYQEEITKDDKLGNWYRCKRMHLNTVNLFYLACMIFDGNKLTTSWQVFDLMNFWNFYQL